MEAPAGPCGRPEALPRVPEVIARVCAPYRPCLLFFGLLCVLHGLPGVQDPGASPAAQAPRAVAEQPPAPPRVARSDDEGATAEHEIEIGVVPAARHTVALGRGGTLAGALDRLGVPPAARQPWIEALRKELDLAKLPPTTGLSAAMDDRGALLTLSVRADVNEFIRVTRSPRLEGALQAERVTLRSAMRIESGSGQVRHSVRQALDFAAGAEELTLAFADIFQWDIDLLVEPRRGDQVSLVYQIRVLDDVPPDLPPFGGAATMAGEPLGLGRILAASYDGHIARSNAFWVQRPGGGGSYYDDQGAPMRKTFLKSPLNYRRISSGFSNGRRHPVTRKVVPHHGIDFAAAAGTPVVAAADGRVVSAGWDGALGRAIRIRHGSEYVSVYGHLRGFASEVHVGAEVHQDQIIGYVGSTGRATGPHLHYTLIHRGQPIDPMRFRNPPAEPLAADLMSQLDRIKRVWAPLIHRDPLTVADDIRPASDRLRRGA